MEINKKNLKNLYKELAALHALQLEDIPSIRDYKLDMEALEYTLQHELGEVEDITKHTYRFSDPKCLCTDTYTRNPDCTLHGGQDDNS